MIRWGFGGVSPRLSRRLGIGLIVRSRKPISVCLQPPNAAPPTDVQENITKVEKQIEQGETKLASLLVIAAPDVCVPTQLVKRSWTDNG